MERERAMNQQVFSTVHYFWSNRDRLGHGATGTVYVGYDKATGERRAIKMFAVGADFKALKREIDVVSCLPPHDNIVRLYGVEEEVKFHNQVIVMELCTCHSLYEVIDSPDNAYGLCETEFKQVIYDVAKGLQHLRKHHFVHRDIKPGNIMRCQKPDSSYMFKLADFGTARTLAPGETFISLHGTEEYLYPGMYERALVNPHAKTKFAAKVDLWSVGATFFHAATGRLPFQPFKKRDDRALMYRIISEKKPLVISGWQLELNGRIIYSTTLPQDTRLSLGLKLLITNILGGLIENDLETIMEFDDFFKDIEKVHRKKVIDVFCVCSCTSHKIFIDPDERAGFVKLKGLIELQTGLETKHQVIFHENLPYNPSGPICASQLPVTTAERPIFVFGGNPKKTSELEIVIPPTVPAVPRIGSGLSHDLQYAKECAKIIHYFRYITEEISRLYKLMHQAALCFGYTVRHEYSLVEQQLVSVEQLNKATCRVLSSQIAGLINSKDTLSAINQSTDGLFSADISKLDLQIKQKRQLHSRLMDAPMTLQKKCKLVIQEEIINSWDSKYSSDIFDRSVETIQYMQRNVDSNYQTFINDRRQKSLSHFDQTTHEFIKNQLQMKLLQAQEKVVTLQSGREQVYSKLGVWFNQMIPMRCDIDKIGTKAVQHAEECSKHLIELDKWEEKHILVLNGINQRVKDAMQRLRSSSRDSHSSHASSQVELPDYVFPRFQESMMSMGIAVKEQRERLERKLNAMVDLGNGGSVNRQASLR